MSPEISKTIASITEAMKSQPLALGLIVITILFMGIFVWIIREVSHANVKRDDQRDVLIQELQKTCDVCRMKLDQNQRY
jgi:hypothetical protein